MIQLINRIVKLFMTRPKTSRVVTAIIIYIVVATTVVFMVLNSAIRTYLVEGDSLESFFLYVTAGFAGAETVVYAIMKYVGKTLNGVQDESDLQLPFADPDICTFLDKVTALRPWLEDHFSTYDLNFVSETDHSLVVKFTNNKVDWHHSIELVTKLETYFDVGFLPVSDTEFVLTLGALT